MVSSLISSPEAVNMLGYMTKGKEGGNGIEVANQLTLR